MKKMTFQRENDVKKRMKTIMVYSETEDKECTTRMKKGFVYQVTPVDKVQEGHTVPEVHIRKTQNSKNKTEGFSLRVQGTFYLRHERMLVQVRFTHTLDIDIHWKKKSFFPKKSEILT